MTLVTTQLDDLHVVFAVEPEPDLAGGGSGDGTQDFLDALLAALTGMAALSPRRQADVAVAMRRAGLRAPPETIQSALDRLRREGCVDRPLHLLDGGILVSVTARGIERLAGTAHRHVVAGMMAPDGA